MYTCFVDFTKLFDYIDRSALYYQLLSRGIDGNCLKVRKIMLSEAECRVKWASCISEILIVYLLFAEDLVLFSDSANGLQKQLTALYKFASLWHIIVSIPKTKVPIINKCYTSECNNFYYGDNVIEKAEKYKYLGAV